MSKNRKAYKTPEQLQADKLGIEYQLWKPGVYSFKCPHPKCLFDSVELGMLLKHIQDKHLASPAPEPQAVILTDKYGNPQPGPPGSGGNR